ncbi:MAG: ABC transporter ATP-binding protein [Lachnospiraceae bacterium]|nr:ABC transporter ATP-binding protein [Lachnospiraceae bacterium]
MKQLKKIWTILDRKDRSRVLQLLLLTMVGALLELLGVSAIMPFVNVTMDPSSIQSSTGLTLLYTLFRADSVNHFLIWLAMVLVVIYLVKNSYLILLYNFQYKFTFNSQKKLEGKLLSCYLTQEYSFHLENNTAELQRNILQDVTGMFNSVLAYLQLCTELFVCLTLFIYLVLMDTTITMGLVVILVIFVLAFQGIFRKKTAHIGAESRTASGKRVQWVQQSLDGIKEIKILGREKFFLDSYDNNAAIYADRQRKYQLTMIVPRPIMETLCICSMLILVAYKLAMGVDLSYFIPILSVFVVAAFRLLPSFSRISGYIGAIAFQKSAVDRVVKDIQDAEELQKTQVIRVKSDEKLTFTKSIDVDHVRFIYPHTEKCVLEEACVQIPKNKSVAFIGPSGAGKTTLADVILGILEPQKGHILVDGRDIYQHLDDWHHKLGYIPQSIYLMDSSIRSNIAFGIPEDQIDDTRIREALKEAQLSEFVETLEDGINTYIGERGVRLSGGQRQRIGIARALYTNPEVLILDEATSALDNDTEKAIMEAIDMLQGNKTLIIIAHRLSTIQNCDYIYEIKDGKAALRQKEEVLS